ncbi:hypothetical protein DLAC_05118 [Tieghemostelium lacteum]|uniref:Uncharacterized protein n=1 Tax=Tieghemostelium lacteum TaxID=361077 RepID=A0A151ZIK4_TIELA|nr:hypothetical protein DLAC_05118 [Tieghemostelium lacteum]|eukprot:KYQ93729.1 hypothetical protein DLAC_05118 [Tieghemostelium lacteum]
MNKLLIVLLSTLLIVSLVNADATQYGLSGNLDVNTLPDPSSGMATLTGTCKATATLNGTTGSLDFDIDVAGFTSAMKFGIAVWGLAASGATPNGATMKEPMTLPCSTADAPTSPYECKGSIPISTSAEVQQMDLLLTLANGKKSGDLICLVNDVTDPANILPLTRAQLAVTKTTIPNPTETPSFGTQLQISAILLISMILLSIFIL